MQVNDILSSHLILQKVWMHPKIERFKPMARAVYVKQDNLQLEACTYSKALFLGHNDLTKPDQKAKIDYYSRTVTLKGKSVGSPTKGNRDEYTRSPRHQSTTVHIHCPHSFG